MLYKRHAVLLFLWCDQENSDIFILTKIDHD